ncbi:hypothetical protein LNW71_20540 [Streptomyces sp. RKAG290]|nr:hypothetical protein [Streptomyces sp. RKAG290]
MLASPELPGEVWAHFSAVHTTDPGAFATLQPGEAVHFTWEEADLDGYSYRALRVRRPGDPATGWEGDEEQDDEDGNGGEDEGDGAMSYVRIEFDHD